MRPGIIPGEYPRTVRDPESGHTGAGSRVRSPDAFDSRCLDSRYVTLSQTLLISRTVFSFVTFY